MATQHIVKLNGIVKSGQSWVPAGTHQADSVVFFKGSSENTQGYFCIDNRIKGQPVLITGKGKYPLTFNRATGVFEPTQNIPGVRLQVSIKKIVAKLIYWA